MIGVVTKNSGGTLQLTFTGGNAAQVSAVLRQIAYANASDAPPASVVLGWTVSDGNTGAQGSGGAKTRPARPRCRSPRSTTRRW